MRGLGKVLVICWMLLGAHACDGDQCVGVSDEATVPYFDLIQEVCSFRQRCDPTGFADEFYLGTVETCVAWHSCALRRPATWTVTPACLQAVRDLDCAAGRWAADNTLLSTVCTVGGPLPPAQEGEMCEEWVCRGPDIPTAQAPCEDGFFCGVRCTRYTAENQFCRFGAPFWSEQCEPGTYCDLDSAQCERLLMEGEPCAIQVSPEDPSDTADPCGSGTECEGGVCTRPSSVLPYVGEGGACGDGMYCQTMLACVNGTCQPIVCGGDVGSPCAVSSCASELACNDRTQQCEVLGPSCNEEFGPYCESGTWCDSGHCQIDP